MRVVALLILLLSGAALAERALPALDRVVDEPRLLRAESRDKIARSLKELEETTGAQGAVVIIDSTKPEEIEQFSIRLAESWKLGRKGVDDGFLFIVAIKDRRTRIEVGYGLEGVIPDVVAKRLIEEFAVPFFREGKFEKGIERTLSALIGVIKKEPLPKPENDGEGFDLAILVFIGLFQFSYFLPLAVRLIVFPLCLGTAGGIVSGVMGVFIGGLIGLVLALLVQAVPRVAGGRISYGGVSGGFRGGGGSFGGGGASGSW